MGRSISLFIILAILAVGHNEVNARATLKIVNGTDAEEGEFPYMVQLLVETEETSQFVCGGSIIGPEWILTAAHCVAENINHVGSGNNHLYHHDPKGISQVKESFAHPKFTYVNGIAHYDIGLLQLEKPLEFTDKVQALKLPDNEDVPFHVFGNLSGWGRQSTSGHPASYLQKISLRLLKDQECIEKINGLSGISYFQPDHHLCSDDYQNGVCYGDSGSPFVIYGTQYGVVSWSFKPCGSYPGAYSRITNPEYREWIRNVTGI